MQCKVDGCRYPEHHRTYSHQCGNCTFFGHGQRECMNGGRLEIEKIGFQEFLHDLKMPLCDIEYGTVQGIIMFLNPSNILDIKPGEFDSFNIGQGMVEIYRNTGTRMETITLDYSFDSYKQTYDAFIKGYIKHKRPEPEIPLVPFSMFSEEPSLY